MHDKKTPDPRKQPPGPASCDERADRGREIGFVGSLISRRHITRNALGVVVGLAVSAFFIYVATRQISLAQVESSLSGASYGWLVPVVALTFLTIWLRAVRWRVLFADPDSVSPGQSFAAVNIGLMFNNLLPSRGGEVTRIFALRRATGLSAFEVGMTIVVERILDVFVLAVAGLALWPWLPHRPWINVLVLVSAAVVMGSLLLVGLLAAFRERLPLVLVRLLGRLPFVSTERAQSVRRAVGAGSRILLRPGRLLKAVALSVSVWGAAGLSGWLLFPAFHLEVGSLAPWLLLVANSFALTLPSSPAAVGPYEASIQASLVAFGVSTSAALSFAVVLHAVNFFPVIVSGAVASWWMARQESHERFSSQAARVVPSQQAVGPDRAS